MDIDLGAGVFYNLDQGPLTESTSHSLVSKDSKSLSAGKLLSNGGTNSVDAELNKKRRLILYDSDSESFMVSVEPKSAETDAMTEDEGMVIHSLSPDCKHNSTSLPKKARFDSLDAGQMSNTDIFQIYTKKSRSKKPMDKRILSSPRPVQPADVDVGSSSFDGTVPAKKNYHEEIQGIRIRKTSEIKHMNHPLFSAENISPEKTLWESRKSYPEGKEICKNSSLPFNPVKTRKVKREEGQNQDHHQKPRSLRLQKIQTKESKILLAEERPVEDHFPTERKSGEKEGRRLKAQVHVSSKTDKSFLRSINLSRYQLKNMLLRAGWKITVKSLKGVGNRKCSSYISPEGKQYELISEAYNALGKRTSENDRSKCLANSGSAKIKKIVAVRKEINEDGIVGFIQKKNKKQRNRPLITCISSHEAKRSVLSWLIDSGVVPLKAKVNYMNKRDGRVMLEGFLTKDGVICKCCGNTFSVGKFEIHAGSKIKRPYENIFLEGSSVSLLQCLLEAWKFQDESKRSAVQMVSVTEEDPNDDTCGTCGDGGDLICCDSCPATFHLSCLGIQEPPSGDWHCMNCICRFCGQVDSRTDHDHNQACSSLFSCEQCRGKYHQACIPDAGSDPSFCGNSCKKIFKKLQGLVGLRNEIRGGFSWTLVRRFYDDSLESSSPELAMRVESNSKAAVSLSIIEECFLPISDRRSGINLLSSVLYNCGSNFNRLDHQGFYIFTLEREDEIISAASVRIHGKKLAEMPFIGTRQVYRRQGMCRRLLSAIEQALISLGVENLVIPAIPGLVETWTSVFGFEAFTESDRTETRNMNILVFPGTGLLKKPLLSAPRGSRLRQKWGQ